MFKKLLIYYNFIVVTTMVLTGFVGANTYPQLLSAVLFFPLAVYFWFLVAPKKSRALTEPKLKSIKKRKVRGTKSKVVKLKKIEAEELDVAMGARGPDAQRRAFIKLIGSAGMTVFLFSIFTKRAQAAFFGSVPGPGIVGVKDSDGNRIDPAKHHPTDGYKINRIDDDSSPAYYGFTNADGAWFIMRESTSGGIDSYEYASGSSNFSSSWAIRNTTLTYGEYSDTF